MVERETPGHGYASFTTTNTAYVEELYRSEVKHGEVESFLKDCGLYDASEERWTVPEVPTTRADLVSSVFAVIRSVVGTFVKTTPGRGVEREVIEIRGHGEADDVPALVVRAAGPSFEIPSLQMRLPVCPPASITATLRPASL